jgi:hypothetical protein
VKPSKAQTQAKYHKIPVIHFEDQKLTSFSGLLIFQVLFKRLRNELPRRKRTGYQDHPHKANFATSGGELNPNKNLN